jgi:hypothetical protein
MALLKRATTGGMLWGFTLAHQLSASMREMESSGRSPNSVVNGLRLDFNTSYEDALPDSRRRSRCRSAHSLHVTWGLIPARAL